eukprot:388680_1
MDAINAFVSVILLTAIQIRSSRCAPIPTCTEQSQCLTTHITEIIGAPVCMFEVCVVFDAGVAGCGKDNDESVSHVCFGVGGDKNVCNDQDEEFCCDECDATGNQFANSLCTDTGLGNGLCGGTMSCLPAFPDVPFVFGVKDGSGGCGVGVNDTLANALGLPWTCAPGANAGNICDGSNTAECQWTLTIPESMCTGDTDAPTTDTPAPTTDTPAPTTDTPAPTTDTPAPTTDTPAPTTDTPAPTTDTPAPTTDTPAPTADTPAPTITTFPPTQQPTAEPIADTPAPTITTFPPTHQPTAEPIAAELTTNCTSNITHFDWDYLFDESDLKPYILHNLSIDEASLSLIIDLDLEYLGYAYADDHTYGYGVTYVLDFEDYDAEQDNIREPGNCQNRIESSFTSASFADLWIYSDTPYALGHLGYDPYLAYPPPPEFWNVTIGTDQCTPIHYHGEFSWFELLECTDYTADTPAPTITTFPPTQQPTAEPIADTPAPTITTFPPTHQPTAEPIAAELTTNCTSNITHFDWDYLFDESDLKPYILHNLSIDEASLSLIIDLDLEYLGYAYADDHTYGYGVTYVLDFEDYDAEQDNIREPGNCQNRIESSFTSASFADLWIYSDTPYALGHLGYDPYLAYPPPPEFWNVTIGTDQCTPIHYHGEFSWFELLECTDYT